MQPLFIAGYNQGGLIADRKPFLLPDQAFAVLKNAYCWRDRVKKRENPKLLGRLRRVIAAGNLGLSGASPWTFTIYSTLTPAITGEPNAEIVPGSVEITVGVIVFTDDGDGNLSSVTPGNSGKINYVTGSVTLTHTAGAGVATTIDFSYYPALPVMGINTREISTVNTEQTLFYDTKYVYTYTGTSFAEFLGTVTWSGTDADFFWATNYRGANPFTRLYFVTNFVNNANNPIRYTDGATWTSFAPLVSATNTLYQARIIIPYYGRLLMFNVWEGTTAGGYGGASNIFNRCRFSQLGDPTAVDAWRSDIAGKGGFIDAPTNEAIISAAFIKNTLLVFFERSTWQLRYVGEYGIPFIWERISSDFGSESTFSPTLFDDGVLAIGDKAIVSSDANTVQRIDTQVPDLVFDIRNAENGPERVQGIRNFQKEVVYWNYSDAQLARKYPNKVIVYNYRNNTYAIFQDNVTAFGPFQSTTAITWDSLDTYWDDNDVFWDDVETQSLFPIVASGNQQGFIHYYAFQTVPSSSLAITAIDTSVSPNTITVPNHNLESTVPGLGVEEPDDGVVIQIVGTLWDGTDPLLNDNIYGIQRVDDNTLRLYTWNTATQTYVNTPTAAAGDYIGGGTIKVLPTMYVQTKDFNPFQAQGLQLKHIHTDFLVDTTGEEGSDAAFTVELFLNTSYSVKGNLLTGQQNVENSLPSPYYTPQNDMAWHRFHATSAGQYVRIIMTYDDDLINDIDTSEQDFTLNAMNVHVRPGGKIIF